MNTRLRRPAVALITGTLAASVLGIAPAAFAADGTVTGVVSGADGVLEGVEVGLYRYDTQYGYWDDVAYVDTDENGAYSIAAAPGDYRIGFADYANGHVDEYFDDAADLDDADTLTVSSGGNVVASATLAEGAHITGEVTGPGPTALQNIRAVAYEVVEEDGYTDYAWAASDWTDQDGAYDITGLAGGTYRVEFIDGYPGEPSTYATEYYEDQVSLSSAQDVAVAAAGTVSGIDAELTVDAQVSGRVTAANGAGVEDAWISALVKVGDEWEHAADAYSSPDGTYVLDGLGAGTYRVRFAARVGTDYVHEYWNNRGRLENAQDVTLTVGDAVPDVDAQLVAGEHLSETTVTNTVRPTVSGTPVVGATLTASVGAWSPTPTEYYYDWLRDGEFIMGQYDATYTLTAADIGHRITVLVTAGAGDYEYGHAESLPVGPVAAPVAPAPAPTPAPAPAPVVDVPAGLAAVVAGLDVSGKPKVGRTLKVSGLDKLFRSSTAVTYKFQWLAGSKKIKKATKSKLKVTRAMKGKKISVKVTATAASTSKTVTLKVGKVR